MSELKLYSIPNQYVEYLRKYEKRVFQNKDEIHGRKYLGIVLTVNSIDYCVPMSSPKDKDYVIKDGKHVVRKSIIPIIRMTETKANNEKCLLGTLKFSNMIPISLEFAEYYDLSNETDKNYKNLVLKELEFIKNNINKIKKNADIIYRQKCNNEDIMYIKNTVDFKLLENKFQDYMNEFVNSNNDKV